MSISGTRLKACLLIVVIFATVAEAKETELYARDNGVLGAMHREGCRSEWLSAVSIKGEKAEWVNFRNLAKRVRIDMPDTCEEKAPAQIAEHSRLLIARESKLLALGELRKRNDSLANQLKNNEKELTGARERENRLGKQVVDLAIQLDIAKNASAEIEAHKWRGRWWLITICCLEGMLLILVGIWASSLKRKKVVLKSQLEEEKIKAPENEQNQHQICPDTYTATMPAQGKTFAFKAIHYAECNYCEEKKLRPTLINLRSHIVKVHPDLLEEETAEKVA